MRRCAAGDAAALEAVFDRYAARIASFAFRMMGDRHLAESLSQETFLRLLEGASLYSYPHCFSSWVFAIARNACFDELKKKKPLLCDEEAWLEKACPLKSPLDSLVRDEEERQLAVAIQALPDTLREVLILRIIENLSYAQIAEIVECSESTARSRMDYALGRLRQALR